ncbi:MAG TPA: cyclase family protein [Solirubrobacterales bacterium]|nr:cyclase family protein [Solirubrobacterales bacterium]
MTDVRSGSDGTRKLVDELADRLCNWDRWDRHDGVGALNLVTPGKRLEGSAAVRSGEAFSLGFELRPDLPQPSNSGRLNPIHLMTELPSDFPPDHDGPVSADDFLTMAVHAATHWDALSHFFHRGRMYGGISSAEVTTQGAAHNDIVPVARRLVTRGVLADVARHRGVEVLPAGEGIGADELRSVLDAQGVEVRPGDALLVRTGLLGATKRSGAWTEFAQCGPNLPTTPGVAVDALPLLHELGVCAIACDNWAVEQLTGGPPDFPVHELALVYMGMILGENFELDALAEACAAAGRWEFLFAGQPLPLRGGVGGPVNPMAVL